MREPCPPGRLKLSDFTNMGDLAISIAGAPLDNWLYHFRPALSGWEHGHVVLDGESFVAPAEGLQNALWALGCTPLQHRSDMTRSAYQRLNASEADGTGGRLGYRAAHGWIGKVLGRKLSLLSGARSSKKLYQLKRLVEAG